MTLKEFGMIPRKRVLPLVTEKLGDRIQASEWLRTPNEALNDKAPVELLNTDTGLHRVATALNRLRDKGIRDEDK